MPTAFDSARQTTLPTRVAFETIWDDFLRFDRRRVCCAANPHTPHPAAECRANDLQAHNHSNLLRNRFRKTWDTMEIFN